MSLRGTYAIAAVVVLGVGGAIAALTLGSEKAPKPAPSAPAAEATAAAPATALAVTAEPLVLREVPRTVEVVGSFVGLDEVGIVPKVQGNVVKLHCDVGDVVRPGDLLLEIDPVDFQLAVDEATMGARVELAKLGLTDLPAGNVDLEKLPSVARARNLEENFRRRLARSERLRQNGNFTEEEYEQAQTDLRVAEATRQQSLLDVQSTLATARHKLSLLATAQQRLRDTKVIAPQPSDGRLAGMAKVEYVVAERNVAEGEMLRGQTTPAFRLVIDRTLEYHADVPERYTGEVQLGQPVTVHVEAYPGESFAGKIARISPTVDRNNRTFQVEALVANEKRLLKAGGFAKGEILLGVDPRAATVAVEALVTSVGVNKVFVIRNGAADVVEVALGAAGPGWVEIRAPIEPGTMVITSGQEQLVKGTPVRVRPAPAKGAR